MYFCTRTFSKNMFVCFFTLTESDSAECHDSHALLSLTQRCPAFRGNRLSDSKAHCSAGPNFSVYTVNPVHCRLCVRSINNRRVRFTKKIKVANLVTDKCTCTPTQIKKLVLLFVWRRYIDENSKTRRSGVIQ